MTRARRILAACAAGLLLGLVGCQPDNAGGIKDAGVAAPNAPKTQQEWAEQQAKQQAAQGYPGAQPATTPAAK